MQKDNTRRDYNLDLIDNRFETLEEKVDDLKGRVDDLNKINNVLIELKHLSQHQGEMIERLFESQTTQNNTLVSIAKTQNELGYRVNSTESTVEDLNKRICEDRSSGTIEVNELVKNGILVGLGSLLAAILSMVI